MSVKNITVNGAEFKVTLTDQVIRQVNSLKGLYEEAYEDPESFNQISYQISSIINEIAAAAEPRVSDSDLDGLIQKIIKLVENSEEVVDRAIFDMEKKPAARRQTRRSAGN